jgi:hypothetical protein
VGNGLWVRLGADALGRAVLRRDRPVSDAPHFDAHMGKGTATKTGDVKALALQPQVRRRSPPIATRLYLTDQSLEPRGDWIWLGVAMVRRYGFGRHASRVQALKATVVQNPDA